MFLDDVGQHIVLPELGNLLVNATETRHLLDLANFSPQLIDVMLSLAVNQYKVSIVQSETPTTIRMLV